LAPVRIGNCSGFYGDRHAAMREMVTGGELDYITGDYLAELTMLILARDRAKSPERGYAKTFLTQLEDSLGTALDKGVKIVANAGGLNPAGLAAAVRALAERLGLTVNVAHVEGDDLVGRAAELGFGTPPAGGSEATGENVLAANAYLGAWSPMRRSSSAPPRLTSAGAAPTTTPSPARSPRATSSNAAPRPPAATSPSSPNFRKRPTSSTPGSPSPRSTPTARR
jgi:hypothetical protein